MRNGQRETQMKMTIKNCNNKITTCRQTQVRKDARRADKPERKTQREAFIDELAKRLS